MWTKDLRLEGMNWLKSCRQLEGTKQGEEREELPHRRSLDKASACRNTQFLSEHRHFSPPNCSFSFPPFLRETLTILRLLQDIVSTLKNSISNNHVFIKSLLAFSFSDTTKSLPLPFPGTLCGVQWGRAVAKSQVLQLEHLVPNHIPLERHFKSLCSNSNLTKHPEKTILYPLRVS